NEIADFDGDGNLDILITSMMGNDRGGYQNSYLYYGQTGGDFDPQKKVDLPGREAYEQAFVDLDDDGDNDILLINRGEVTRLANEVWIYWNENNEYSMWNMSGLPSYNGLGVQVADLDKNGYLDIIVSNGNPKNLLNKESEYSFIYWGSKDGWNVPERTVIPIELTRSATVCDINYDGHLDLVFGNQSKGGVATIFYGNGGREFTEQRSTKLEGSEGTGMAGVADLNNDGLLDLAFAHNNNVMVYYQNVDYTFGSPKKIGLQAKTMTIADFNQDGWLDLVCPYYKGNGLRSWYSSILLGGPDGFKIENRIKLPTDGGTGSLVADFNRDGFMDVFFYCHRKDGSFDEIKNYGDHHTNSVLYWGSKNGFDLENVTKLPSVGVHYDMGIDIGNISNRKNLYSYVSSPYELSGKVPVAINWKAETPHNSSIVFQIRTAETEKELKESSWRGPNNDEKFFDAGNQSIENVNGRWIQYRAIFNTDNGANSPILKEVVISFE
ncbi:MAG: VCBS repeat-containing protein, partial [Melioribacteraceae bacterium]|nr:VCBS repeat-containing protein [Melioribacteraceae bacterium]